MFVEGVGVAIVIVGVLEKPKLKFQLPKGGVRLSGLFFKISY